MGFLLKKLYPVQSHACFDRRKLILNYISIFSLEVTYNISRAVSFEVRAHWNANKKQGKYVTFNGLSCFSHACFDRRKLILNYISIFSQEVTYNISRAVSFEVRAHWNANKKQGKYVTFNGLSCFSPVINIMRHPLWGRNQVGISVSVKH